MTMLDRTPSRELQEHLWVFPMDYPIKLIGLAGTELRVAVVEILVKHFQCDGLINIQFKQDDHGVWHILEINPRPAGGFAYTQHTGINLIAELIAEKLHLILKSPVPTTLVQVLPIIHSIKMECKH